MAMALSVGLHALLLFLAAYCDCFRPASVSLASGYRIVLTTTSVQSATQTAKELPAPTPPPEQPLQASESAPAPTPDQTLPERTPSVPATPPAPPSDVAPAEGAPAALLPENPTAEAPQEVPPTVDERGLYTTGDVQQAGAQLELPGWIWDAVPQPQDDSDERGKIVFEIKIDAMGEVVAIKTLEKTVSPLVAEIYKEALTQLTFSKTSASRVYAPISTGKVTFVIRVK